MHVQDMHGAVAFQSPEEVGHGHVTGEFIWRFTILKCVLGSLYNKLVQTKSGSNLAFE